MMLDNMGSWQIGTYVVLLLYAGWELYQREEASIRAWWEPRARRRAKRVRPSHNLPPDKLYELRETWRRTHEGVGNAHRTPGAYGIAQRPPKPRPEPIPVADCYIYDAVQQHCPNVETIHPVGGVVELVRLGG